ncbi:lipopolysaccharide transport periplasmic protein LptA [Seohaeicola zhoushanensis]|uniref:Organic solvent tolerance protein OstA n=1 Tax=Seohaeicola zhoushanensis TaxID=1569283 RepID=A0A8J3M9D0_9RHOB|nr:lipopolysaccharide transport periplasmic protein LptA [Seohaeicola zhoushanensis]GHF65679.1 organic solvent tolerance protein OstA [Seohaeicola zhoushanensis]
MIVLPVRILAVCVMLAASAVQAQTTNLAFGAVKADTSLPVEVTADSLDVNQTDGSALFKGNVLVGQGEMKLTARQVLVVYNKDGGGIQRVEATGDVVLVSGPDAAEADRADYSIDTGVIVMTGNVLLTQGPNALTSDRATVNLATGTAQMNGRVKTVLNPKGN